MKDLSKAINIITPLLSLMRLSVEGSQTAHHQSCQWHWAVLWWLLHHLMTAALSMPRSDMKIILTLETQTSVLSLSLSLSGFGENK